MAAFEELGVMPETAHALDTLGWTLPTEIQAEAIPLILGGGDILMASETGSGKTGAFCIPVVQIVYEQILENEKVKSSQDSGAKRKKRDDGWTLSPVDRANDVVLDRDLLMAKSKSGNWQGCRTNKGIRISKGHSSTLQVYYEVHFAEQGLARVGWSQRCGSFDLGTDKFGWGYGGTAKKSHNRQFQDYGQPFGEKFDIIGCILDLRTYELKFTKNGRALGAAFKVPHQALDQGLYPTLCIKNAGCTIRLCQSTERNDYKPKDCIWIAEVGDDMTIDSEASSTDLCTHKGPLAIVIEPSRELAIQTFDCLETFSKKLNLKCLLMVGGADGPSKFEDVHIVVGTPGRMAECLTKNLIPLHNVHFFILDEADCLVKQGSENFIKSLHSKLPKMFNNGRRLQTICCSATLHNFEVKKLSQHLMYFPTWIDLKGEDSVPETVHHVVLRVNPRKELISDKLEFFETDGVHSSDNVEGALRGNKLSLPEELSEATKILKFYFTLKAIEKLNMDQGIIFCRTKIDCDNLENIMSWTNKQSDSNKYSCVRLHSSLSQAERTNNLNRFKRKEVRFLICTDVAARGIDVRGVPYVIQVTLPDDKANYIHRIGRVGRAERMGLAISLVATEPEKVWYHTCRKQNQCHNSRLIEHGGCCKWFDELAMLAEIEEHLKCTIQEMETSFELQVDEYDGRVVYGAKRLEQTLTYEGHVEQMKSLVSRLAELETRAQENYLKFYLSAPADN